MKTRIALTLIAAAATLAFAGCSNDDRGNLTNGGGQAPADQTDMGGGTGGDQAHNQAPNGGDPSAPEAANQGDPGQQRAQQAVAGKPETAARLHSCSKIQYTSLGSILQTRGVNMGSTTANSAGLLYKNSASALGTANYVARIPEASFASTSTMTKQMDIFAQAASEIAAANWTAPACPSVKLFDATGNAFTKDGISCLIGKPAKDEHVALANQAIKQAADPATGKQLAISAMLSAAHSCE
jgi:hypothetical protein